MPAKKAATEAPAKQPAKAEQAKKVEDKKQPSAAASSASSQKGGASNNNAVKGGQQAQAQAPRIPLSNDPIEAAIQTKINKLEAQIAKFGEDMDKTKKSFEDEKTLKAKLNEEKDKLHNQLTELSRGSEGAKDVRGAAIANKRELIRLKNIKQDEAKLIREKLPVQPGKDIDTASQDAYLKKLDTDIRTLEGKLSSSAVSLLEEKKMVEEISQLQKAKKIFKDYVAINEKIAADKKAIKDLDTEIDKTSESRESSKGARDAVYTKIDELRTQIAACKKKSDEITELRNGLFEKRREVQDELISEKNKLKQLRDKKREEEKARRDAEYQAKQARYTEMQEKRKERDAERKKEEDKKIPYEPEMDVCSNLIQYLESLLPAKPKEVSSPATARAVPEGAGDVTILKKDDDDEGDFAAKKKGGKKQKALKTTQDLKHNIQVFGDFEFLSLTPPKKVADIEASIEEIKEKKAHYSKLSAASIAAKQEAAKAEAAKAAEAPAADAAPSESAPAVSDEVTAE